MAFLGLRITAIAALAISAAGAPNPTPQVSIEDSLIPSIPGVTEPLSSNAIPLPILQLPTPPLDSPPWTGSEIKPKKIGYVWTGAGDNEHADFLASYSLDDDTFGTLLRVVDVPTSGNSPHHSGMSFLRDSTTINIDVGYRCLIGRQDPLGWRTAFAPEDPGHGILL